MMFAELIKAMAQMMDVLANTDEGHKVIDDLGSVIGRLYKNLVEVQGLPPEAAAAICSSLGKTTGK